MAYADDIVIIGKAVASMKEAFQLLEEASNEVGLAINEGKTKYMVEANTQNCSKPRTIQIGGYSFERVDSYTYLGSLVNADSNVSEEITNLHTAAKRSHFGLKSQFNSQSLSRKTKILIYTTLVRPVLTYAAETWTTTKKNDRRLNVLERKIPRRILGPICEEGQWRKSYNRELQELYNEPNIANVIKSSEVGGPCCANG